MSAWSLQGSTLAESMQCFIVIDVGMLVQTFLSPQNDEHHTTSPWKDINFSKISFANKLTLTKENIYMDDIL